MKKQTILMIICLIALSGFVALGRTPSMVGQILESITSPLNQIRASKPQPEGKETGTLPSESVRPNSEKAAALNEVPDEIVYFVLFNHLVSLQAKALEVASRGESLNYLKLYEDQVSLNASESEALFQTAQECVDAISPIDEQARHIITQARRYFPKGEVQSPEDIPAPPKELENLQQQKDGVVLRYRDVLRGRLGDEQFAQLNQFARQKIAPEITGIAKQENK